MKYVCIVLYLLSGINVNTGQHTHNTCLSTSCAYNYKQSIEEYRCYTNHNCPTDYICCEHACFFHKICIPLNKDVDNLISFSTPDPKLVFEISSSGGATCPNTYCLNDWKEWNEGLRCYKHYNCKEYELCCNHDCYGHKICLDPVKSMDLPKPLPESSNICRNTKCSVKHKITNIKYQCIDSWDCKLQYNCCNHDCFNHKICIRWNKGEPPIQIDNSSIDNFTTESDNSYPENTTEMPNISVTFSPSLTSTTTTSEDNYLAEWSGSGVDKNYDDDDEVDESHKTVTTQRLPNSSTLMKISEDDDNINNYSDDDDDASKSTDKTPFSTAVVPSTIINTNVSNPFDDDIEESSGSDDSDEEINEDDDDNGKDESTSKEILTSNTLISSISKVTTADNEETEVINNSVQYTTVTSINTNVSNSFDDDIEESSGSDDSDEEINEDDDDNGKDESTSKEILTSNTLISSISKVTTADNEETEVINNSVQYTTVTSINTNVSNSFDDDIEESSGSDDSDEEINEDDDDNGKDESTSKEILTSNTLISSISKVTTADNEETEVINNSVQYTTVTSINTNVSNSFDDDIEESSGSDDSDEEINEDDDDNGKDESTSKEILTSNTLISSISKVTTADNEETELINNSVQYTTVTSDVATTAELMDSKSIELENNKEIISTDENGNTDIVEDDIINSEGYVTSVILPQEIINSLSNITDAITNVSEDILESENTDDSEVGNNDILEITQEPSSPIQTTTNNNVGEEIDVGNSDDDIIENKFPAPTILPTRVEVSSYENGSTEGASFLTTTLDNISSKNDVSEEKGSASEISDTKDDSEDSDDVGDIEHADIKHSMQSTIQTLNLQSGKEEEDNIVEDNIFETPSGITFISSIMSEKNTEADSWNEKEKSSTVTTSITSIDLNDLNASISEESGSGSGSGTEDTEGNDDDIEDNENGSGSITANPNLKDNMDKGSVRQSRDSKINLPDYYETVQSWCRDINCTKAKLLPSDVLQLISMNPNTALSYEPTDFVEEDETWYSKKDSNLKFMVDEKGTTLTTVLDELICPGQLIHDTNLLCHGTWNCIKSYHCRHHPCYSHKVCMNKRLKVQECPIIQEMCDDPLVLMELKYLICESAFDCSEPNIFKNNYNIYDQMDNRRNMKIGCCQHECLPRHKICRKMENVSNFKEMMHSMEITARNIGNPAMNRALIMNLIFMVIAGIVYLWLY